MYVRHHDKAYSRISASGDRSIRLWDINTGAHLFTLGSAHPRGIASLDFLPSPGDTLGTIATGSSDATVRLCHLVHPSLADSLDNLSITNAETHRDLIIEEGPVCWTDCVCPPALRKVNSTHCMRCWNRGHTALVRTLCLNGDNLISGGYDGTVKVSLYSESMLYLCSHLTLEEQKVECRRERTIAKKTKTDDRYGTKQLVNSSTISLEQGQDEYSP